MRGVLLIASVGMLLMTTAAFADDVLKRDLPAAVRTTVEKEARGATIEDIDRERHNGAVVYEVELERNNQETTLIIDESGKVLDRRMETDH